MPSMNIPLLRAEELIKLAEGGEQLDAERRRICIAYMVAVPEFRDRSNIQLAKLFGVGETTIRKDKDIIRKQAADEITKDDISLVIADIRQAYERFVVELARSKKQAEPGTRVWLDYHVKEMEMQLKVVDALQSLGYYPKNLGAMTTSKFVFKAHVARDGSVNTLPVVDGELVEEKKPAPKKLAGSVEESPEERTDAIAKWEEKFSDSGAANG